MEFRSFYIVCWKEVKSYSLCTILTYVFVVVVDGVSSQLLTTLKDDTNFMIRCVVILPV